VAESYLIEILVTPKTYLIPPANMQKVVIKVFELADRTGVIIDKLKVARIVEEKKDEGEAVEEEGD